MSGSHENCTRGVRRQELALRFLEFGTRTQSICNWTGLTEARVQNISADYKREFPGAPLIRPPGPSPKKLAASLRSPAMRGELAAVGGFCRALGVIPAAPFDEAERRLPSVPRGEQACAVFKAYLRLVRTTKLTMELLLALLVKLADGTDLEIGTCTNCPGAILIEKRSPARRVCMHCRKERRKAGRKTQPGVQEKAQMPTGRIDRGQQSLFETAPLSCKVRR